MTYNNFLKKKKRRVVDVSATTPSETLNSEGIAKVGKAQNGWQLFTSQGLILISILNNPGRTVREIGLELNLTDRAVMQALKDLESEGYLRRERVGRRSYYHVNEERKLKYPVSSYGSTELPNLTVKSLRAENLATHIQK